MTTRVQMHLDLLERESPFALRLAELASLAVRIDTGLLRRLRRALLLDADAGAESDLWFSSLVESRSADGFQLRPAAAAVLRERLRSLPDRPKVAEVRTVLAEAHQLVSPAIRLEEEINGLALEKGEAAREDIDTSLRPALKALASGGPEAAQVARWAIHAAGRFHPVVMATDAARLLVLASALLLRNRVRDDAAREITSLDALGWALSFALSPERQFVAASFVPGGLRFHDSTDESTAIPVPATRPRFISIEWTDTGGGLRSALTQAADGELVPLAGDPTRVTLTTLTGERYDLDATTTPGSSALLAPPSFPPDALLQACMGIQAPDTLRQLAVAFGVASDMAVTVQDAVDAYEHVISASRARFEVIGYIAKREFKSEVASLRAQYEGLGRAVLRLGLTSDALTVRGAVAGVIHGSPRWFDVVLAAPSDDWRTRTGLVSDPPNVKSEELAAAFTGAPVIVDGQAVGMVRRIWPPYGGQRYATVEVTSALRLSSQVALARAQFFRERKRGRVFVSSRYVGLEREREIVARTLQVLGYQAVQAEVLNANVRPSEELAASLQSADVFLAIAGSHQGQIAQTSDDDDRPRAGLGEFVEAEYQRARELGKPTLLFWHADADTRIPVATFRRLHVTYKDVHWFRSPEELGARVIAALTAWNESASEREARPQRPAAESARDAPSIVRVFYATDRAAGGNRSQGAAYRDARGELSYGRAEVSIPIVHRIGDLESPTITRLQFRQDPARHVTLQKVELLERAVLIGELRRLLSEVTTRDALIFVHGYSVTFDDATRRIGQVSYDLRFGGAALLFSWPSTDSRIRYSADEASAEWSTSHFAEFLGLVRAEIGAQVVHVISHGMGARCVARALSTLEPASAGSTQAVLGQVVFVAPDLDAGVFVSLAEQFRRKAERITLYVSSTDRALTAARQMHGYPRAGDAGSDLLIVDGVDTIDATEAQTDLVGHSYVTPLLPDLYSLLDNVPPQGRARLQPAERAGKVYYRFSP